jgi:hypothetical protein
LPWLPLVKQQQVDSILLMLHYRRMPRQVCLRVYKGSIKVANFYFKNPVTATFALLAITLMMLQQVG